MRVALVRSEVAKILSTRLWWGLLIGAVVYVALSALATALTAGMDPGGGQPGSAPLGEPEAYRAVYASSLFSGTYIFAMILGITSMTGEYRYRTITPTFLATPRRGLVVAAKMVAHLLAGVVYGAVGLLAALVAGGITVAARGASLGLGTDRLWESVRLAVLAVALWTLVGIGIGTLIRNQVAAVLIAVLVTFLVEPLATFLLASIDLDWLVRWLPTNASAAMTSPGSSFVDYLDWWVGALVLAGYAAVAAGLGMLLSVRRDIT